MASIAQLETQIRNEMLDNIEQMIESVYATDALTVPASDTGDAYNIAVPLLDSEGNERWALIKVSIPRGKRNEGTYLPYDGYALHEEYVERMESKAAEKKAKKRKEKEKEE